MLSRVRRMAALGALAALVAPAAGCAAPASSPSAASGGEARAIIVGGGATREEGEAWMKRWEKARYFHDDLLRIAGAYPRLVRSDEVPGLRPGFHVVLLGICSSVDAPSRLEIARSVFPGTYARSVGLAPDSCPALPRSTLVAASRTITQDGNRIVVNLYFDPATEETGPQGVARARATGVRGPGTYTARAAAFDENDFVYGYEQDQVFVSELDPSTGLRSTCTLGLSSGGGKIILDATCDEDPLPCSGRTTHLVTRTTYRFDGTALDAKTGVLEERASKLCD